MKFVMCHVLLPFLKMEINTTYKQITDKTTEDRIVNLNSLCLKFQFMISVKSVENHVKIQATSQSKTNISP